jgi:hypothetical protein
MWRITIHFHNGTTKQEKCKTYEETFERVCELVDMAGVKRVMARKGEMFLTFRKAD